MENLDLRQIINRIEKNKNEITTSIFVPSLQKNVVFSTLSALQQKNLLKTSLEKTVLKHKFIKTLNDVIKDNAKEPIDLNKLDSLDKIAICFGLRSSFINDEYTTKTKKKVSLKEVSLQLLTASNAQFVGTEIEIMEGVSVTLAPYSLQKDFEVSKYVDDKLGDSEEPGNVVSEVYYGELLKHITTVKCGESSASYTQAAIGDFLKFLESVDSASLNKIVDYVDQIKKQERNFIGTGKDEIDIDGAFFTSSV